MEATIRALFEQSASIKSIMAKDGELIAKVQIAVQKFREVIRLGGTIYSCGNGGSACDAMHFCEELVSRYKRERPGIRAIHFMDAGIVTCWANDYSFDGVFARQAQTFCTEKDILVVFSTSGNSKNILEAVKVARQKRSFTVGITGKDGGQLKSACDLTIIVPAQETERIQEAHITLVHIFCELIETVNLKSS